MELDTEAMQDNGEWLAYSQHTDHVRCRVGSPVGLCLLFQELPHHVDSQGKVRGQADHGLLAYLVGTGHLLEELAHDSNGEQHVGLWSLEKMLGGHQLKFREGRDGPLHISDVEEVLLGGEARGCQ